MNPVERNPGTQLSLDLVESVRVNTSAVERRAATIFRRRSIKKQWQAAWLLKAITLIDLTTLSGDDTPSNVRRLCAKAVRPLRADLIEGLGVQDLRIQTAAVCVYHGMVEVAANALANSEVHLAAVSTGFPSGLTPLPQRLEEIRASVAAGADEIDIVVNRHLVLGHHWSKLYEEIRACREACGDAHMKTILATGELGTLRNVARASEVAMMAGSDFIKTSTGKEPINATLPVGLVMVRAIRRYYERTGYRVGFKPAGGIRTAKDALAWMVLMKEELGRPYLEADLFRFGASALLSDIERQLDHHVSGRYSAYHHHAMA